MEQKNEETIQKIKVWPARFSHSGPARPRSLAISQRRGGAIDERSKPRPTWRG